MQEDSTHKMQRVWQSLIGNSLRTRLLRIITAGTALCLILILFVMKVSWTIAQYSRVEAQLTASLQDMQELLDSEYGGALTLSQNMIPNGMVGASYDDYLMAETQYDRISSYQEFANALSLCTSANDDILLAVYYLPETTEGKPRVLFSNYTVSETFAPQSAEELFRTTEVSFLPVHITWNRLLNWETVAVRRPVQFRNGQEAVIYVEARTTVPELLESKSELEDTSYILLQLNQDFQVVYCSSEDKIPIGTQLDIQEGKMVRQDAYIGVAYESQYGFTSVLLLPESTYFSQNSRWMGWIVIAVVASFAILALMVFPQIWIISKPIKALEDRMRGLGGGKFQLTEEHSKFNMKEFDHLFEVFDQMQMEIQKLMEKNEQQAKENTRLELEKLKYQINPHFLMNALNTVRWMALTDQHTDITPFVNRLGYILAYSLGKTDRNTSLRTELKALRNYLELQQVTYDYEFQIDVEEGDYLDRPCARFILQPIAENSVCHNMDEFGHLWVEVHKEEDGIRICMRDDGKGFVLTMEEDSDKPKESRKNKGIGLLYLRRTLEDVYGGKAVLSIESVEGKGTMVQILLPEGDIDV